MRGLSLIAVLAAAAGCVATPPPDPVTLEEVVQLSKAGAGSPALVQALESRPLAFPLTWESLKKLEEAGVPGPVIDTVMALTVEKRARSLAQRYSFYYDPWGYPYPYPFHLGLGYHHHR